MQIIAKIHTDFKEKFGIPRQSGLSAGIAKIVFEAKYRRPEALRGLDGYSHIWLIWKFSELKRDEWSPTVRPPRLGGNKRVGVFATRSPYRPNPIGLSSVRLVEIRKTQNEGTVLIVEGADLLDGTPIYDVKPYLPFTDSHPDATAGFAGEVAENNLEVKIPDGIKQLLNEDDASELTLLLSQDPRPHYKADGENIYGMSFKDKNVSFKVSDGILTVEKIDKVN